VQSCSRSASTHCRCALAICLLFTTATQAAEILDDDAKFPEGPVWHDDKLYYVEYGGHSVRAWDVSGSELVWEQEGCGPSAVAPLHDGTLLVTCYDAGTLVAIDGGETVRTWSQDRDGGKLVGPNDISVDANGAAYVTLSGPWASEPIVGRVLRLSPNGTLHEVADDLHYANGIAVGPDGKRLYVAESEAYRIISFEVAADGSLSDRRLFVRLADVSDGKPGHYPDGIKFGPDGDLWIGQFSHGDIIVVSPQGELADTVTLPSPAVPNLAFDPDGSVYVMAVDDVSEAPWLGKVYRVER